jgi:hypothetical protein
MAGAEHGDLRLHLAHRFEQQHGGAAAALAQAGAEAEALQMGVCLPLASISRAICMALYSRCPPPMVSKVCWR